MIVIKEIKYIEAHSLTIRFSFLEFKNKYAYMVNDIIRSLVSNHFSVESSFGYDENYKEENIYKKFKEKEKIESYLVFYEYGKGFEIGAIYKPSELKKEGEINLNT